MWLGGCTQHRSANRDSDMDQGALLGLFTLLTLPEQKTSSSLQPLFFVLLFVPAVLIVCACISVYCFPDT